VRISVVIPTHNRWETLDRTLATVLAQDCPRDEHEVIIVDDGSVGMPGPRAADAIRRGAVTLLRQAWGGHIVARNTGLRAATGDAILYLDDDIICPPHLISAHLAAHRATPELMSYGPIFLAPDSPPTLIAESTGNWYRAHWARVEAQGGLRIPVDILLGSNSAFDRRMLLELGGFDEAAPSKDDTELGIRIWKRGTPMRFLPDAVAHELFVKASRDHVRGDAMRWGRAEHYICMKHPEAKAGSGLGSFGSASWWKRLVRRAYLLTAPAIDPLLFAWYRAVEVSGVGGPVRRLARVCLETHAGLAYVRGASLQAGGWAALGRDLGARLAILLYHHVGPSAAGVPPTLTSTPEKFEREVRWLAEHGYQGVRLSDWAAWVHDGTPLPPRPVAITFDDAYADVAEHALPVLERFGFGATVYVVSGQVGGDNGWDADKGIATLPCMDAASIRAWASRGIEFGAHTRSHRDLTRLAPADQRDEIVGSADELGAVLGEKVTSFAYPYGRYDDGAVAIAASAFSTAVTCDEGLNFLDTDPSRMRRTMVYPIDGDIALAFRARWGLQPLQWVKARIAFRRRLAALRGWLGPRSA